MTGQEGKTVEEKSVAKGKQEAQEEDRKIIGGYDDEDDEDEEVCVCFSIFFLRFTERVTCLAHEV